MRTNLIKVKKEDLKESPKEDVTRNNKLDMVIAFDTTGSMSSYIENVKRHCIDLVPELLEANPDMRIGIVAFGDYCDMPSKKEFGKAYQVLPLSNNKSDIISFIYKAMSTSGGDGDEFYELVIRKINEETDWREDASKAVLFIADADPHPIGYSYGSMVQNSTIDWIEEAKKAKELGIVYDTLSIGGRPWYKKLSEITGGVHAPFKSSSKTQHAVKAAIYSKKEVTRGVFEREAKAAMDSSDKELANLYSTYSKSL